MQRVRKPKRLLGLDKWSTGMLIALFVVGILIVLVDVGLMAGFVLQSRGISLPWWTDQPTAVVEPVVRISPLDGGPGTVIAVAGQGWQANDPLVVELEDPSGTCAPEVVATPNAGQDGRFSDSIAFPSGGCWANQTRVLVVVRSVGTGLQAASGFGVIVPLQTPTPTLTWTPTVEPTATQVPEPTSTAVPTATPAPESTPTATPTPVVWPTATPTPAITDWRGEYFDNVGLIGVAVVVRNDRAVDFDWGYNAPVAGAPADGFSARWTRAWTFDAALYRFYVAADDGIRLYVDGDLIVNEWRDGSQREVTVDRWMTAGTHTLRVEYYERSGVASARFRWEKVTSYPDWKGEYWPNLSLQGNPALVRNDAKIAFDWKQGSPGATIPGDAFSARWTRSAAFDAGTYRFHALVDDGVRLWLNNRLIIDAWSDHNAQELTTEYWLAKGTYALKVEYYERIGNARIQVWWEKVTPSYAAWKGEYWPNRTLSGDLVLVRNDQSIDFGWGVNAPASSLPVDDFSARWTRQASFEAATYRFHVLTDDGARLWVDGQLLIDQWHDQEREFTVDRTMVRGTHDVKVEYYEHTGGARIKVWWEVLSTTYPDWKGEYWPNRDLNGDPVLVRNDLNVDFNWGTGAPVAGLPADNFSARWSRQVSFQPGVYQLLASADDGIRVYVDGKIVLDQWHTGDGSDLYAVNVTLNGVHQIQVRYYEQGGSARVQFRWKRIGDLPTPVPTTKVQLSSAVYTVDEGAGTATITVLLSAASDRTVTVNYGTSGGTATPGSDFAPASGTLTFGPGVTSQTFAVNVIDDAQDEPDETVILVLGNPTNAVLGAVYQATLAIVDNDVPPPTPEVRFSSATYSVDEGAGTATITVLLSVASDHTVTVNYGTSGGTATPGSDFAPASGTLTFSPGVTSQTFAVNVIDDAQDEEDETVILVLGNPTNAVLGAVYQATLAIVDNDTTPAPHPEGVRLNEVLPAPAGTDWDGDGTANEQDEWIELYNAGSTAVDLGGWSVNEYQLPPAMVLDAGQFLVLYRQKTGIALQDVGDTVLLSDPAGKMVDSVTFGEVGTDASDDRSETDNWYVSSLPSPGATNVPPMQ